MNAHELSLVSRDKPRTKRNICIFAAEWYSLSVNFFTARDGIVMFSHYFKPFSILVQITIKVPICSRIGPEKVPILPESPFFPLLQHNSAQSPDGKILEGKHWIYVLITYIWKQQSDFKMKQACLHPSDFAPSWVLPLILGHSESYAAIKCCLVLHLILHLSEWKLLRVVAFRQKALFINLSRECQRRSHCNLPKQADDPR